MDEEYDVIVLGTGFIECVLSGLLSVSGKKVLHMDRNNYYGGESASLNLEQVWEKHAQGKPPAELGKPRDYNIDLIPKFIMASGKLVQILLKTKVTRYLEFKQVDGSFVIKKGKVHKVPVTETEGLTSGLVGLLDKNRLRQFLGFCSQLDFDDAATHKGMDLGKTTFRECLKKFKLGDDVAEFLGHACALYTDDSFLDTPAREVLEKMALYATSLAQHGKSPFLYPLYGLGELPQAFARLAAIYGGTYMLSKPIEEIQFDDAGAFTGVKSEGETVKAKLVVGDPSYFTNYKKVEKRGQVVRCICILGAPIPQTNNAESCQIIIPQGQCGRKSDIYIACVSSAHNVAAKGKYIAMVSTTVETDDPNKEVDAGLALLGPSILHKVYEVSDLYAPTNDSAKDKCYISSSYDATSHFESASAVVMSLYKDITGEEIDLTVVPDEDEDGGGGGGGGGGAAGAAGAAAAAQ